MEHVAICSLYHIRLHSDSWRPRRTTCQQCTKFALLMWTLDDGDVFRGWIMKWVRAIASRHCFFRPLLRTLHSVVLLGLENQVLRVRSQPVQWQKSDRALFKVEYSMQYNRHEPHPHELYPSEFLPENHPKHPKERLKTLDSSHRACIPRMFAVSRRIVPEAVHSDRVLSFYFRVPTCRDNRLLKGFERGYIKYTYPRASLAATA